MQAAVTSAPSLDGEPVFLTRPDIRRFVRQILEPARPRARVVAYSELLPETHINCLARATLVGLG
jgi:type III secretory pathway component EscV